jgi:CheY-like chemotaxis protein
MTETETAGAEPKRPLAGRRVLIVEDAPAFRAALSAMARALGASVSVAETAEEGAAALEAGDVDLAIVDVGLPDFSGAALLAAALARGERAALLACSAEHDASAAPAADLFAPKPFASLASFGRAVSGALAIGALRRALEDPGVTARGRAAFALAAARFRRAAALGTAEAFAEAVGSLDVAAEALGLPGVAAQARELGRVADAGRAAARLAALCDRAAAV